MNMRITMVMLLRHAEHVSITATRFAQLSQQRACPQGTSANTSKHTSQVAASAAVCGAVDVVVGVAAVISVVVIVVVVAVDVRRLQRSRVSAHGMTNGKQELESRIRPVVELGQTGLDS